MHAIVHESMIREMTQDIIIQIFMKISPEKLFKPQPTYKVDINSESKAKQIPKEPSAITIEQQQLH